MRLVAILFAGISLSFRPALAATPTEAKQLWGYAGAGFAASINDDLPGGSIGLQGGMFYRLNRMPALAVGGEIDWMRLGSGTQALDFGAAGTINQDVSLTAVPITLQAYALVPVKGKTQPIVTVGLGIYTVKTDFETQGHAAGLGIEPKYSESETKPGLNFGGGLKLEPENSGLRLGFDARFHLVHASGQTLNILAILGRVYF